jgi:SAM-dependent methyltransferase
VKSRKAPPCPLCQSLEASVLRIGVREDPTKPVYRCPTCQLQFLEPRSDLREYYREEYRKTHSSKPGTILSPEERFKMLRPFAQLSADSFKEDVPAGASVLEIGCSSGAFLDALGPEYDRFGLEWNPEDAAYVRDVGELPCEEGELLEAYAGQKFDAIVALQVFEHVGNPIEWLRQAKSRLIGGGWLYLEVPNVMEALNAAYATEEFRDWYYRDAHVTYWEPNNLASALGAVGFEAKVGLKQRYGIRSHMNWIENQHPLGDYLQAAEPFRPVPLEHPFAPALNRWWRRVDREYRVQMETLFLADTLTAICRRREL